MKLACMYTRQHRMLVSQGWTSIITYLRLLQAETSVASDRTHTTRIHPASCSIRPTRIEWCNSHHCLTHFDRLQLAPAPSQSSTLCWPPSSSRDLSTPSNRLRLSVTEARPPLLLLAGVLGVLLLPGLAAEAGVPEGGGPPRYFTTARVL